MIGGATENELGPAEQIYTFLQQSAPSTFCLSDWLIEQWVLLLWSFMSYLFISLPLNSPWSVKGNFDTQPCWNVLYWFNRPWIWSAKLWVPLPSLALLKRKLHFCLTFQIEKSRSVQAALEGDNKQAGVRSSEHCVFAQRLFTLRSYQKVVKGSEFKIPEVLQFSKKVCGSHLGEKVLQMINILSVPVLTSSFPSRRGNVSSSTARDTVNTSLHLAPIAKWTRTRTR